MFPRKIFHTYSTYSDIFVVLSSLHFQNIHHFNHTVCLLLFGWLGVAWRGYFFVLCVFFRVLFVCLFVQLHEKKKIDLKKKKNTTQQLYFSIRDHYIDCIHFHPGVLILALSPGSYCKIWFVQTTYSFCWTCTETDCFRRW